MKNGRSGRPLAWLAIGCAVLALAAGAAWAQEDEEEEAGPTVPPGFSYGVQATASYHWVNHAYFGADWGITSDPHRTDYTWGEGFTRLRLNYGLPEGVWASVGGTVMTTQATDYYGTDNAFDGLVDRLAVGIENAGGGGFSLTAGRQDLQVGDGDVNGDGYADTRAALWNIPLAFYDGVKGDLVRGPWHALAFGARLSPTFAEEGETVKGFLAGAELGWSAGEERALAVGWFQREDDGTTDLDARALSVRGAYGLGGLQLAGELVEQFGQRGTTDLEGRGGHADATWTFPARGEPYVQLQYLQFSGDDPGTEADESYQPWQYGWTDWSRWYVADLVGSTLLTNSDTRVWKLECGWSPCEQGSVRLLLHRIDLDSGASWGGLPDGIGRGFADEADLVFERELSEHWSAWVMGGYARPREAAKELVGAAASGQVFASITYTFEGVGFGGGGSEPCAATCAKPCAKPCH